MAKQEEKKHEAHSEPKHEAKVSKKAQMRVTVKHDGKLFEKGADVPDEHKEFFAKQGYAE